MSNLKAQLAAFVLKVCKPYPRYWKKKSGKLNAAAFARDIGVSGSTITRLFEQNQNVKRYGKNAAPEYDPSQSLINALMRFGPLETIDEFWEAVLHPPDTDLDEPL